MAKKDAVATLVGKLVGSIILGAALSILFAWATAYIVNHVFTAQFLTLVFGAYKISFWQAFWLNLLIGFGTRS
jgi:hypothetical protein